MKGLLGSILVLGVFGATLWFLPAPPATDLSAFPTLTDATLADRTIVDFGISEDGTVAYSYLADDVPELLDEAEILELRTENSFTKLVAVSEGEDPTYTLQAKIYSQPAYAQDVDGRWKYLEYATTTGQAFRNRDMTIWKALTELVIRTAYADSVSPFAGAGDGSCGLLAFSTTWAAVRGAGAGTSCFPTGVSADTYSSYSSAITSFSISRTFLPFDTSAISSAATISAASLNIYVTTTGNTGNDGTDYLTLVQTSQPDSTTLTVVDYDNIDTTEGIDSGQRKDITSISTSAYLAITLNATGMGWIKKNGVAPNCGASNGVTCLGLREGHDNINSDISALGDASNLVTISMSEESGTAQDPYLSVTYSVPGAAATNGLSLPSGGININGGGLQIF